MKHHFAMKKLLLLFFTLVQLAAVAQRTGHDYAVFFVASKFDNGWTTLDNAPAEVKAIGDLLRDQYGFEVRIVADATRSKIVQTLAEYKRKEYKPQDQLLLFFSMHGVHDQGSDQGYLVPKDGLYDDPSYESWYSHAALRDLAHSMKCPRILIALDACYSGIFGKGRDRPGAPAWENAPDCQTKLRAAFGEGTTRKYLTAGGDTRVPARSIFAAQWQVALKTGTGSDDLLSYTELMAKLDEFRDPRPTWGNFIPGTDGDFVFVRKNPCAVLSDRDGDNIPDAADQCPDEWGSQANGCPAQPTTDLAADLAAWKEAKRLQTESSYRSYLRQYPNGEFKEQGNAALRGFEAAAARQRDDTAWDLAEEKNTLDAYKKYLADYPTGLHKSEADQKVGSLSTSEKTAGTLMPDGMIFIKGGKFQMGSPPTEADRGDDEQQHEVELSDFYIGKYEVTQKQWRDVMGSDPPVPSFKNCDNCPVENVSWDEIQTFIKMLNQQTGRMYRLPTEAEWEYAARGAGKATLFGNGKNISAPKEINFDSREEYKKSYSAAGAYPNKTVPVGSLSNPNALGLHDMSGNVYEWCSDWYDDNYYKNSPRKDPTGPISGSERVMRGGSWGRGPEYCRAADRDSYGKGSNGIGFRLARTN
ncbi:MAG: SUMF1/EgtB/PvdO family nonheme iron enzyme [Phycisphaerae bacterium]|nr:SUMF1/EgtB/PvdO family nonheme iron enzyme [Saprospiraceae bacterium]